jgi:hypothetical protein
VGHLEDARNITASSASLRHTPQRQEIFAQSSPADGEAPSFEGHDGDEELESDQEDVFEDAQEYLSPPAHPRQLPQQQEASAFAHSDPFGGEDCRFDSDNEEDGGVDEQVENINLSEEFDGAQESVSPAHTRHLPHQQTLSHHDPFDFDDNLEQTSQSSGYESAQESHFSPARPRYSSDRGSRWTMPESEK